MAVKKAQRMHYVNGIEAVYTLPYHGDVRPDNLLKKQIPIKVFVLWIHCRRENAFELSSSLIWYTILFFSPGGLVKRKPELAPRPRSCVQLTLACHP